jgi:hypothetical protein
MAQDEIVVKYKVDASEFGKVGVAVNTVTAETKELQNQIKATFADKSIEQATKDLYEQGDVMGALITKYGSATTALKAMEKELATMAALGQRGTESFNELATATAELKDTIGDTRGEIKKMASDTKVFDTMVQGARGVAAAFSVATGVAAAFGSENENVQKALLKVQGTMAALQGVQELANIATEKGGIATKAYGVALQVVDKISKVTGLSMAASWALATAGVTLLIAGVVALIAYLNDAGEATEDLTEKEKRLDQQRKLMAADKENSDKKRLLQFEKEKLIATNRIEELGAEIRYNTDLVAAYEAKSSAMENVLSTFSESEKRTQSYQDITAQLLETELSRVEALKKLKDAQKELSDLTRDRTPQVTGTDNVTPINTVAPLVTQDTVDMNKINAEKMNIDFKEYALQKSLKDQEEYASKKAALDAKMWADSYALAQQSISAINTFVQAGYNAQLDELQFVKQKELDAAGDNAVKRTKIEQKFAIESAKIARQKAIAEKAATIFGITISLAQTIQKITAEAAVLASNPVTAALSGNAYAQLGIAIASSAIQIATVAATPLPAIPKFEKGGRVVAGGRNADGHLIGRSHRDGGILIEAQGQEYIWDRETTAKHGDIIEAAHKNRIEDLVFHKYVVPMLRVKATQTSSESYDDILLRKTIDRTGRANARFIVDGISNNMKDIQYFANRYQ